MTLDWNGRLNWENCLRPRGDELSRTPQPVRGGNPQGLGVRIEAANASQGFLEAGFFRGTGGFGSKSRQGGIFEPVPRPGSYIPMGSCLCPQFFPVLGEVGFMCFAQFLVPRHVRKPVDDVEGELRFRHISGRLVLVRPPTRARTGPSRSTGAPDVQVSGTSTHSCRRAVRELLAPPSRQALHAQV